MLALTLPTGGGRSVGIVRSRTKVTELKLNAMQCTFMTGKYFDRNLLHDGVGTVKIILLCLKNFSIFTTLYYILLLT